MTVIASALPVTEGGGGVVALQEEATTPSPSATSIVHTVLNPEEARRAIIVHGLPLGEAQFIEETLIITFGSATYGHVNKVTLHQGGDDGGDQMAIILYANEAIAEKAATFEGEVLGKHITVERPIAPAGDGNDELHSSQNRNSARRDKILEKVTEGTAAVLAESVLFSQKGLHALKQLDEKAQITRKIKAYDERTGFTEKVKEYDRMNNISHRFHMTADTVNTGVKALDEKYGITRNVKDTADKVSHKAMENEFVKKSAEKTSKAMKIAESWAKRTWEAAKQKIESKGGSTGGGGGPTSSSNTTDADEPVAWPAADDALPLVQFTEQELEALSPTRLPPPPPSPSISAAATTIPQVVVIGSATSLTGRAQPTNTQASSS